MRMNATALKAYRLCKKIIEVNKQAEICYKKACQIYHATGKRGVPTLNPDFRQQQAYVSVYSKRLLKLGFVMDCEDHGGEYCLGVEGIKHTIEILFEVKQ